MELRPATDEDWYVFFGTPVPTAWAGFVAVDRYMIAGIGGLYQGVDGRWWACMTRVPGVRARVTAQRAALLTLEAARIAGHASVYAVADERIPGAALWLERLGFELTDELTEHDQKVWRYGTGIDDSVSGRERGVDHDRRRQFVERDDGASRGRQGTRVDRSGVGTAACQ